jgi:hypothetical protein
MVVNLLADLKSVSGFGHHSKKAAPRLRLSPPSVGLTIFNPLTTRRSRHRCNISSDRDRLAHCRVRLLKAISTARSIAGCAGFLIFIHSRQRPER